ncbi:MAG TPA: hypothetical protein VLB07_07370 [Woeseiaceae bacterium]|nr:hypothetical protein [Woeseiaceae bacterium]
MTRHEDSDLEQRLRADAQQIVADVSPELRARIEASIRSVAPIRSVPISRDADRSGGPGWWASGLTGLAAALLIILLVNTNRGSGPTPESVTEESVAITVTPEVDEGPGMLPLKLRTADLTGPLEEELVRLQADIEKARQTVERDLRLTL